MRRIFIACAWLCIAVSACAQGDSRSDVSVPTDTAALSDTSPRATPPSATTPPARSPASVRPATKRVAIRIEGMVDSMELRLVRSPEGWTPPFSTYRPADMLDEATSSDEGDGLRFIANFGGVRNDDAFVHVFIYPATATEADLRRMTEAYVGDRPERVTEARRYTWTILERPFSGRSSRGEEN